MNAIFDAFDTDGNGVIDFNECVVGLAIFQSVRVLCGLCAVCCVLGARTLDSCCGWLLQGSMRDRLKLAFNAFDSDHNGHLDQQLRWQGVSTGCSIG